MRNFKKTAIRMHLAGFGQSQSGSNPSNSQSNPSNPTTATTTLFVESALRPRDARSHAVVQCFPLSASAANAAPGVIKQSVDDSARVEHAPFEEAHRDREDRKGTEQDLGFFCPSRVQLFEV